MNRPVFMCKVCLKTHPAGVRDAVGVWKLPGSITTSKDANGAWFFHCTSCVALTKHGVWEVMAGARELERQVREAIKIKGLKIKLEPDNSGFLPNPNHARLAKRVVSRIETAIARKDETLLGLFRARSALRMMRRPT